MRARLETKAKTPSSELPTFTPLRSGLLQGKCACGGTPGASGECESCRKKKLQRRSENLDLSSISHPPSSVSEVPPIVHEVLRSPGQPLDRETRAFMEPRFGHDFSNVRIQTGGDATSALTVIPSSDRSEREADDIARQVASSSPVASRNGATYDFSSVRVHTDSSAAKSARALNARAYTVGNNIVFADGQYSAGTSVGRELVAHELAHVVQARANPPVITRNALYRKAFEANEGACTATLSYLVQLNFKDNRLGFDFWDPPQSPDYLQRQSYFRNDFKKVTEDSFNGNAFRITPHGNVKPGSIEEKACPCHDQGFKPKLQINLLKEGEASNYKADWSLDVTANMPRTFLGSETNQEAGTSKLDEADLTLTRKDWGDERSKQIPAVHEVGHLLGLDHPGTGVGGNIPNEDPEYEYIGKDVKGREVHGPSDLMGQGMGLRSFYFDNWRDELDKKYGKGCGWKVVDSKEALKKRLLKKGAIPIKD